MTGFIKQSKIINMNVKIVYGPHFEKRLEEARKYLYLILIQRIKESQN